MDKKPAVENFSANLGYFSHVTTKMDPRAAVDTMKTIFAQGKLYPPRVIEIVDGYGRVWNEAESRWEPANGLVE